MEGFITGFFTLSAAWGTIWLKDYLDNKKSTKLTTKQKAIEAYTLANHLIHSLTPRQIICANILKDSSYNYLDMNSRFPETTYDTLEKLELLIVENFYDLNEEFLKIFKIMADRASFLYGIIGVTGSLNEIRIIFEQRAREFQNEIIIATSDLRKKLITRYINQSPPSPNFFSYLNLLGNFLTSFFKRPTK